MKGLLARFSIEGALISALALVFNIFFDTLPPFLGSCFCEKSDPTATRRLLSEGKGHRLCHSLSFLTVPLCSNQLTLFNKRLSYLDQILLLSTATSTKTTSSSKATASKTATAKSTSETATTFESARETTASASPTLR
jgi:hypothetical protein